MEEIYIGNTLVHDFIYHKIELNNITQQYTSTHASQLWIVLKNRLSHYIYALKDNLLNLIEIFVGFRHALIYVYMYSHGHSCIQIRTHACICFLHLLQIEKEEVILSSFLYFFISLIFISTSLCSFLF